MQKYSFVIGESFVNLTNIETGNSQTIVRGDARFEKAVSLLRDKSYAELEAFLDVKVAVNESAKKAEAVGLDFSVFIENGEVFYRYKGGAPVQLHNAIVDRIISMARDGFDVVPMSRFMANLLSNPSQDAIKELYLFLEACKLPITEDGHFIAYKIVLENHMDIYTGTSFRHQIGDKPEMPRFEVDQNRNNTCSRGLHFCSKEYLAHYGSSNRGTDRAMLVKINPANVVAIPADYNNAKGRAWVYEVVGEVTGDWRATLPVRDFTTAAVVSATAGDVDDDDWSDDDWSEVEDDFHMIDTGPFVFNDATNRWHDTSSNNAMVSRVRVADGLGITIAQVYGLEE